MATSIRREAQNNDGMDKVSCKPYVQFSQQDKKDREFANSNHETCKIRFICFEPFSTYRRTE